MHFLSALNRAVSISRRSYHLYCDAIAWRHWFFYLDLNNLSPFYQPTSWSFVGGCVCAYTIKHIVLVLCLNLTPISHWFPSRLLFRFKTQYQNETFRIFCMVGVCVKHSILIVPIKRTLELYLEMLSFVNFSRGFEEWKWISVATFQCSSLKKTL